MEKPRRRQIMMFGASTIHALWLLFLSFILLNWHFVHWDEGELIQFGPILKKLILNIEDKPEQEELMFVNVSYDNSLVDFFDEETFAFGNERITDRVKLAEFLGRLGETNHHDLILMDIRLDLPSDDDPILQQAIDKTERLLVSTHLKEGLREKPVLKAVTGISDYPLVGGSFFKFQYIYQDSIKTIPVLMDEIINNKEYRMGKRFLRDDHSRYFNIFLTDLLIRPHDIFVSNDRYFYGNLGEVLMLDSALLAEISKDRIIVLGDFEKYDMHETLLGTSPGPLILLNSYYTLSRGLNKINPIALIYLFIGYLILSMIIFIPGDPLEYWLAKISRSSKIASGLAGIFSYFLILILIVLSTYMLFDLLLNVLWLTFYLYAVDKLVTLIYKRTGINNHRALSKNQPK